MEAYNQRFNEVLKHIHFHLDEKLDLEKLAKISCVSKFHFHRLIKAYLGEALGSYINRIKVEKGAKLLKYSDISISDIAYKVGYETPTSFNKSFKKQFGLSPTKFRKTPNHSFKVIKEIKNKTNFNLKVEKKRIEPILVLSKQTKGLVDKTEAWNELMIFAHKNKLIKSKTRMFGITWDDPSITPLNHIRYDACISISKAIHHNYFVTKKIEGGKYMCFTFKGDYKYLGDVYDQIFRDYIISKKILLRDEVLFDQLINDSNNTPSCDLLTIIYVPIQ